MKPLILPVLFLLLSISAIAQRNPDIIVKEGVTLHDQGFYDAAIRKYDSALALDKNHYLANYEKSYTLLVLKKYDECIVLSKYILENFKNGPDNMAVYVNYGSCLDWSGKSEAAIAIYNEGITKYPAEGLLYFNKAITLYGASKIEEAMEADKLAIINNPYHSSAHLLLGVALGSSNKVYGLLAILTFLAIEQEGDRAKQHLEYAEKLIGLNVKKTGEKNTSITLSLPDKDKNAPDDFHMVEVSMSLSAALGEDEKYKNETRVERMKRNLEMVFSSLSVGQKEGKGFGWTFYAPFFVELNHKKYLETFCHIIYTSADDKENNKWLENNQAKVKEFNDWFRSYGWNKKSQ
jgi:hypothetical protein